MSGPFSSSLPLSVADGDNLSVVLDQLNDDQKRYVVQQLLPSILAEVREPRSVTDPDGKLLGYYMPMKSLDGNDLLGASVSDSGTFRFPRSTFESADDADTVALGGNSRMPRRKKTQDLFEIDLGGSD